MHNKLLILPFVLFCLNTFAKNDKEYKVFQFPKEQIPRIDGNFSDWALVPDSYIVNVFELENTVIGVGEEQDSKDFDLNVKVGWVEGLNRLYFYVDAYDDFWDFDDKALGQDIFEVVVDGDASGGQFINQKNWNFNNRPEDQPFFEGEGTAAQNYHIFLPAKYKDWAMPWGNYPWIKEFPYAHYAYDYNFKHGESGRLQMEFYITVYDFASFSGAKESIESNFVENEVIGLSWSMLDFDGESCEAFMNLSHDIEMIRNASYLCKFRLSPLEEKYTDEIKADWRFDVDSGNKWKVHFNDRSIGKISKWHWDFGDGNTSEEQNPVHTYTKKGVWTIVLTVEDDEETSARSKVWEVVTELKE
ncbi:MAG: PKD domain-containing protein [Draconibacterium sp.]|nr:PKD domain-containing protein [Draconibacterium sp.]